MVLHRLAPLLLCALGCATAAAPPTQAVRPGPEEKGQPVRERPSALGVGELTECPRQECPPRAMGMPNWDCEDGRRGGPACRRAPGGACGWVVVDCKPAPLPAPTAPPPVPLRRLEPPPLPEGLQDLGTWTPVAGAAVAAGGARLVGAATLRFLGGSVVSVGGNALRILAPGDRRWTVIQRQPGDNLYRVGLDDEGERLIAAWEKDPMIHVFSLRTKGHLAFPRPPKPGGRSELTHLESVAISQDGSSAIVVMADRTPRFAGPVTLWRVPLDGSGPAEQVVRTDGALLVGSGRYGALFALPPSPRQRCAPADCSPGASALVAWEIDATGARQRTLLSGQQLQVRRARMLRSEDPSLVPIELIHAQGDGRTLLLYRPGQEPAEYAPLPPDRQIDRPVARTIVREGGRELLALWKSGLDLQVDRVRLDGGTPRRGARFASPVNHDEPVFGLGTRADGSIWLQWGDHLTFVDLDGTPTAVDLRPLVGRLDEWAGTVADEATQSLWVGVEVGPRRDYVRLGLDELAARARAWPRRPEGCRSLPAVEVLLRWPIEKYGGCAGGMPNPRAPPRVAPTIVRTLPDGTQIIDAGAKGCVRAVEDTCRKK